MFGTTTPPTYQPWQPPALPPVAFVPMVLFLALVALVALVAWTHRHALMADLREHITTKYGEPRAVRELTPMDVFLPSPRAMKLWQDAGLVVDGEVPTIRRSDAYNGLAYEVSQPRLSEKKLRTATVRLAGFVTDPRYTTDVEHWKFKGSTVHIPWDIGL